MIFIINEILINSNYHYQLENLNEKNNLILKEQMLKFKSRNVSLDQDVKEESTNMDDLGRSYEREGLLRKLPFFQNGRKKQSLAQRVTLIRAGVMGANDGIISVAGIVIGVAGATNNSHAIFISGIGGLLAGNISMAMGEYVSVHSQKDAQSKAVMVEEKLLKDDFNGAVQVIHDNLRSSGISEQLSEQAAREMLAQDPVATIVRERHGFDLANMTSPISAAIASMLSFTMGGLLPLVAILCFEPAWKVIGTLSAVLFALLLTGYSAATLGHANKIKGMLRNIAAGMITTFVTYWIGRFFG